MPTSVTTFGPETHLDEEQLASELAQDEDPMTAFEREESLDDRESEALELGDSADLDEVADGIDRGHELDLGAIDEDLLAADAQAGQDTHTTGLAGGDDDAFEVGGAGADDEGNEGPLAADEELDDGALPAMDADGTGDFEEAYDGEGEEPVRPARSLPWAAARWALRSDLGAEIPCKSLALTPRGLALGTGAGVVLLDVEARTAEPLPGPRCDVQQVVASRALLVASTPNGELFAWRTEALAAGPRSLGESGRVALAAGADDVWLAARGAISRLGDERGEALVVSTQTAAQCAASGGALALLVIQGDGLVTLERLRGDDEAPIVRPLDGELAEIVARSSPALAAAAGGKVVGLAGPELGVAVSRDGGLTFEHFAVNALRAAVFAGDDESAALLGVVLEDGRPFLAELTAQGEARRIAELAGALADGFALLWDAPREVLWVASSAGLSAYAGSPRH
jgi:hypothetical protein